ncbi:AAA family ATPase [Rossellomorea vietnamensis]|uniref:AAA family ATPase n=1 Tax=Rossellomorea vietnamensis TaxID=218284 RepID=UPI0005542FAB|nr:AAA family ATPase [Rossellomorea vietnamensis]
MKKTITLQSLVLKNFKGVTEFELAADGRNMKVLGENATGKTTLKDSFVWVLFDKDSQNNSKFQIKTLRPDGEVIHGKEHSVEATFKEDGQPFTLKKVYAEKWTKKRGSAESKFTGHTTDYYIDEVPVKKKEYEEKVNSIVSEDLFKLITSPTFFNEQMSWQDRRKTLLEIVGDLSDEEVIASNRELQTLPEILKGRTIENHRKVIASRRAEINKELDRIPVRIDEAERSMPNLDGFRRDQLELKIEGLNKSIDEKQTQISDIRNGKAIGDKKMEIQNIEMAIMDIKRNHDGSAKDKVYQLKAKIQEEGSNIHILESKIGSLNTHKESNIFRAKELNEDRDQLLAEYKNINAQEFSHTDECTCPSCGQDLPEEQVNDAREKAEAAFNLKKSDQLEKNKSKGLAIRDKLNELKESNQKHDEEIAKLSDQIKEKKEVLAKLNDQLIESELAVVDITDNPDYIAKLEEKKVKEEEIRSIQGSVEDSVQKVQLEIAELKQNRDQAQQQLSRFESAKQIEIRIQELSDQERELAREFEKLEQELYLTEEFIRSKVNLLEEKINSKFKFARFKLFEQQINDGLKETCQTTFEGVPYSDLNNAAKINIGLDIINTLSDHYGISAPVWIDNAEAVTKLMNIDSQLICLVVSESDKNLNVVYENELTREEAI